jgi:hypothetical protein
LWFKGITKNTVPNTQWKLVNKMWIKFYAHFNILNDEMKKKKLTNNYQYHIKFVEEKKWHEST